MIKKRVLYALGGSPVSRFPTIKMPRRFRSPTGFEVIVGLDASENEKLSLQTAKLNDLWFHAHECPGSHVILRVHHGRETPLLDIEWAAGIAAYYSKHKGNARVKVICAVGAEVTRGPPKSTKGTVTCISKNVMSVKCVRPV